MTPIEIACAAEGRGYVAHTAAMLHSVLATTRESAVRIHWLHAPGMADRPRRRITEMVERAGGRISFVEVPDDLVSGLPTRDFTRTATWYRILLPDLLSNVDRVVHVDSDAIAASSLAPLWEVDVEDHYVAAVTNVLEPEYADRPAQLGLSDPHSYFNAGVMLMNLAAMRRDGCSAALLAYGRDHQPMWRDQDALNVILGHRRLHLHPRWNTMNIFRFAEWAAAIFGERAVTEARSDPGIRHFEGPGENKPWHLMCVQDNRDLYFRHRRATPWARVRRDGVTPRNVARRAKRRLRRYSIFTPIRAL